MGGNKTQNRFRYNSILKHTKLPDDKTIKQMKEVMNYGI